MASIKRLLKQQKSQRGEQEKLKIAEAAATGHESQISVQFLCDQKYNSVEAAFCASGSHSKN